LVLARIQFTGAPATLIAGLYFILSGASRFVEEAYRGESQTKVIVGLKIYQWLSIVSILSGCVLTTIVSTPIIPVAGLSWSLLSSAFVVSAAWAFGMSIDFPRSNARFARLTG
jgi:phosphatidylglycerol:prolipoprotein diacylglycerol transferase